MITSADVTAVMNLSDTLDPASRKRLAQVAAQVQKLTEAQAEMSREAKDCARARLEERRMAGQRAALESQALLIREQGEDLDKRTAAVERAEAALAPRLEAAKPALDRLQALRETVAKLDADLAERCATLRQAGEAALSLGRDLAATGQRLLDAAEAAEALPERPTVDQINRRSVAEARQRQAESTAAAEPRRQLLRGAVG